MNPEYTPGLFFIVLRKKSVNLTFPNCNLSLVVHSNSLVLKVRENSQSSSCGTETLPTETNKF